MSALVAAVLKDKGEWQYLFIFFILSAARVCVCKRARGEAYEEEFRLHPVASERICLWGGLFLISCVCW